MEQIYDFESNHPPVLSEQRLFAIEDKRRLRMQTLLITLASILLQIFLITFGVLCMDNRPEVSLFCFVYVLISMIGNGTVTVIYHKKRRIS